MAASLTLCPLFPRRSSIDLSVPNCLNWIRCTGYADSTRDTLIVRSMMYRYAAICLSFLVTQSLWAGDIRDDVPDIQYTNLALQPQFSGVPVSYYQSGNPLAEPVGSALIGRNWLLGAAHFPPGAGAGEHRVVFNYGLPNERSYNVVQTVIHPKYTGNDVGQGYDFSLVRINGDPIADGVATQVYKMYQGNILDQVVTNVGYGQTGTGLTGAQANTQGTKRAGNMQIRAYLKEDPLNATNGTVFESNINRTTPSSIMMSDFINPANPQSTLLTVINGTSTNATPQALEYQIAPWDSGSPALIFADGQWQIAGVSSFITGNGSYGDISGFSRIDQDVFNWVSSVAAVPEPSTILLGSAVVVGGLAAAWYHRRKRLLADKAILET